MGNCHYFDSNDQHTILDSVIIMKKAVLIEGCLHCPFNFGRECNAPGGENLSLENLLIRPAGCPLPITVVGE